MRSRVSALALVLSAVVVWNCPGMALADSPGNGSTIDVVDGSAFTDRLATAATPTFGPLAQVTAPSATPPSAPTPITPLSPALRASILQAMRLNRQAFQEPAVLKRYGETRPPLTHAAWAACNLARTSSGEPAAQYPAAKARATARPYPETEVVNCLETKGGLDNHRAKPLVQHYYCGLPGFSPDIRGCFTFQLRLDSVSTKRSAVDDAGYMPDGTMLKLEKGWNFLGPDPKTVPDVKAAFGYCTTDGRPHWIKNPAKKADLVVSTIHPTPTRPTCWIAQTQAELFQGIMGGAINPSVADQVALLKEYYECDKIKTKVGATRYKALCEIDVSGWK